MFFENSTNKEHQPLSKLVPRNHKLFMASLVFLSMIHPTTIGYDAMMAGTILNLDSYLEYFNLNSVTIGLNNSGTWIGEILAGTYVTQVLNDKFGRKFTIYYGIACIYVGIILQSAAQNVGMFIVGRIFIGYGGITTQISALVLVSELCKTEVRGFFMGFSFSTFMAGALIASGVTYATENCPGNWNWRIPSIIQVVPSLFAILNLFFLPESPKFLTLKGYYQKAIDTLCIIYEGDEEKARARIEEYKLEDMKNNMSDYNPWRELFTTRLNRHRMFINFTHAILCELAGSSVGTFYLAIMLEQAGITSATERLQVTIVMTSWQLVCAVTGSYMFDKIGRKKHFWSIGRNDSVFFNLGRIGKRVW